MSGSARRDARRASLMRSLESRGALKRARVLRRMLRAKGQRVWPMERSAFAPKQSVWTKSMKCASVRVVLRRRRRGLHARQERLFAAQQEQRERRQVKF